MDDYTILKWKGICSWLGAGIFAGISFLASWFQPIEGIPGYQHITAEDFSIIFGFLFAAAVGGFVGYVAGSFIGEKIGRNILFEERQKLEEEERTARVEGVEASDMPANVGEEFDSLLMDVIFQKTEEIMAAGKPVLEKEIAKESINEVSEILMRKYGLSYQQLAAIIEHRQEGIKDDTISKERRKLEVEERTARMQMVEASEMLANVGEEFDSLLMDVVFQKTEEIMAAGKPVIKNEIAKESINEASEILMRKYGLSYQQMAAIIEQHMKSKP